jgi:hypothetical protein
MKKLFAATLVAACALSATALAQPKIPEHHRADIREFCEDSPNVTPPAKGVQFDNQPADPNVLQFRAGAYKFGKPRNAMGLTLYEDGAYFLFLDAQTSSSFGTDGDDFFDTRLVGGCSREQLSEALKRNGMLDLAVGAVPLDPTLAETVEE